MCYKDEVQRKNTEKLQKKFDEVILYRENPKVDGEYIDIHKGFICAFPTSILNLEVRTIGAKRKGVVDIRVK